MTNTPTLIRLPHTGLRTPDTRLTVTSLSEFETPRGVAFTSTLRLDNKIVGTIQNQGNGGDTRFESKYLRDDPKALTEGQLAEYAAKCQTEAGNPVTVERLLDELVTEFDWTRRIQKAEKKGCAKLRMMARIFGAEDMPANEPYARSDASWTTPADCADLTAVSAAFTKQASADDENTWWQLWRGGKWVDVTTRPTSVPADLYC